jgi:hypothetical protein
MCNFKIEGLGLSLFKLWQLVKNAEAFESENGNRNIMTARNMSRIKIDKYICIKYFKVGFIFRYLKLSSCVCIVFLEMLITT